MRKKETIIVFGAHSDDFVIGAGGTIAEYAREGRKVISIVFSYGERTHAWLKEKYAQEMRAKEAHDASEVLGCKTVFFDLKEGKFFDEYKEKNVDKEILKIIDKEKPVKLFTHSNEDPHPDHRSINKITLDIYEQITYRPKPEIYIYSIWNPISFKTNLPSLYVDITKSFGKKMKALQKFPSQKIYAIYPLMTLILFRAFKNGFKIRKRFAEMFYKIK